MNTRTAVIIFGSSVNPDKRPHDLDIIYTGDRIEASLYLEDYLTKHRPDLKRLPQQWIHKIPDKSGRLLVPQIKGIEDGFIDIFSDEGLSFVPLVMDGLSQRIRCVARQAIDLAEMKAWLKSKQVYVPLEDNSDYVYGDPNGYSALRCAVNKIPYEHEFFSLPLELTRVFRAIHQNENLPERILTAVRDVHPYSSESAVISYTDGRLVCFGMQLPSVVSEYFERFS